MGFQELREFRREVLDKGTERKSIDTFFTDSSDLIAPFMNAQNSRDGQTFGQNVEFLGRAGVRTIKGLRVAFVSGLDCDLLGTEIKSADPTQEYLGNYFVQTDIDKVLEQYKAIV